MRGMWHLCEGSSATACIGRRNEGGTEKIGEGPHPAARRRSQTTPAGRVAKCTGARRARSSVLCRAARTKLLPRGVRLATRSISHLSTNNPPSSSSPSLYPTCLPYLLPSSELFVRAASTEIGCRPVAHATPCPQVVDNVVVAAGGPSPDFRARPRSPPSTCRSGRNRSHRSTMPLVIRVR